MNYGEIIDATSMRNVGVTEIDTRELAEAAFRARSGPANEACITRVNGMKDEYGTGVSALVTIYNALGCNLHHRVTRDFHGHMFKYAPVDVIYNGQWSCFLHTKTAGAARGSCAAVVYDLRGGYGDQDVLVVSWSVPWSGENRVNCYVMNREQTYNKTSWAQIESWAEYGKPDKDNDLGLLRVSASTSQETSPIIRVTASRKEFF